MLAQWNCFHAIPVTCCILRRKAAQLIPVLALMDLTVAGSKVPECVQRGIIGVALNILEHDQLQVVSHIMIQRHT